MKSTLARRLACAAFTVCGIFSAARVHADEQVTMATLAPSALLWTHAVANAEGFYSRHHVTIRELRVGSSSALVQAVATGSANAGAGLGDAVVAAVDRGAPVTIAGSMIGKSILRLVVAKDVPDIKSLNGATVTAGAVSGGTANLLKLQLADHGVDPTSVRLLSLTNSKDRVVALANGQVKGALLIAPFDTLAERQGMKVLDVYREPYIETALIFNKDWAKEHHRAATDMTLALKDAANWLYDPTNRKKAVDVLAKYTNTPRDVCEQSYDFIILHQKAIGVGLRVVPAGIVNLVRLSDEAGVRHVDQPGQIDVSKYYDSSFLGSN
ncbi:ABC transporter substrate-binding protein [Paraburkholderia tropica]|uniref:ABC transporter substrate-binding protein n=1 Tax=Paraburkholderia tropica TaxID=92647 RepID=UPI00301783BE